MCKVLVVVDMQNDFISGSLGTEEAKKIIPNVVQKIKEYNNDGNLVVFTKDTHDKDYMSTQEGKNLPVEHCIIDTWGWKIDESCRRAWKETKRTCISGNLRNTFYKNTFGCIELAHFFRNNIDVIDEVEFCGLVTNICVISNIAIVKAFCPELKIKVDASCCAGVTVEKHKEALSVMESIQVEVVNK